MSEIFAPTLAAAQARISAVEPAVYARTRNMIDGAVSTLSPYITHGFITLADVVAGVAAGHALEVKDKFFYELGWREYFRHVWRHRGEGIFRSLHEGPLPDDSYSWDLPADIRNAHTGVPVVDEAVRMLYASGTLHNHARMWLASYVIHLRKVHWRAGADWLYGHLLDGDLASNHLSWQWVAGTGSQKPYLFNADNVARFAPPAWRSPASVIDTTYESLDQMARTPAQHDSTRALDRSACYPSIEPRLIGAPPDTLDLSIPDAAAVEDRDVWLVHPWSLGKLPENVPAHIKVIGIFFAKFHRDWPWSEQRWNFVGNRMSELASERWYAEAAAIGEALERARSVRSVDEPHIAAWLPSLATCDPAPALFPPIEPCCDSFSQWWARASRGVNLSTDPLEAN